MDEQLDTEPHGHVCGPAERACRACDRALPARARYCPACGTRTEPMSGAAALDLLALILGLMFMLRGALRTGKGS